MLLVFGQAAATGAESAKALKNPPPGFTALFNGQDFTGWRLSPKAKAMWSIEEGVLKAPALLEEWGADLETEKKYQDFVLQADFRMPAKSDSGIFFRRLIPDMGNFGQSELFKIRSDNGMGLLLSFQFMPENVKKSLGLESQDLPQIKPVHPAIKVWHTVKLTVIGTRLMAELDGDRILDFPIPERVPGHRAGAYPLPKTSLCRRRQSRREKPLSHRVSEHLHQRTRTRSWK